MKPKSKKLAKILQDGWEFYADHGSVGARHPNGGRQTVLVLEDRVFGYWDNEDTKQFA
jgi:predicted RNA binding protein YcfA (HicA-like mRNA interferase family)